MEADGLRLTPTESVRIVDSTPEALEVEARYGAHGEPPPMHYHPAQDEEFEVLAGEVRVRAGDEDRSLRAGETVEIPRGTRHQIWNPGDVEARVRWRTIPAGRTEAWFRAVDRAQRMAGEDGAGPLAFGVLMREYGDTFRLAVGPEPVSRAVVAALAFLGRLRGHKADA